MPEGNEPNSPMGEAPSESSTKLFRYLFGLCASCLPSTMSKKSQRNVSETSMQSNEMTSPRKNLFPIEYCPLDIKLKIFSFLTPLERGKAARVCTEWCIIMRTPVLWGIVDLSVIPPCSQISERHHCSSSCYSAYKKRLKAYIVFLENIKPNMKTLRFSLDIYDCKDNWLSYIKSLLSLSNCRELEYSHLNWAETPAKTWMDPCTEDSYGDIMHKFRSRQRCFVRFFELFTTIASNVKHLVLPFDWSFSSLKHLQKMKKLNSLYLLKYFNVQSNFSQDAFNLLFSGLPSLKKLVLEVWTQSPRDKGLLFFYISSCSIEYLDISQCRGIYIDEMMVPNLTVFKMARRPWSCPYFIHDNISIPCIYDIICKGCPSLKQLNEHTLQKDWNENIYDELEVVLLAICSCRKHNRSNWPI